MARPIAIIALNFLTNRGDPKARLCSQFVQNCSPKIEQKWGWLELG